MSAEETLMFPQSVMELLRSEDFQSELKAAMRDPLSVETLFEPPPSPMFGYIKIVSGIEKKDATLRRGLVGLLESFLNSEDDEYDKEAIELSIKELTENNAPNVIADLLRPLYIKGAGALTDQKLQVVAEKLYDFMKPKLQPRKRKPGNTSSNRGPKTETMEMQLKAFTGFVASRRYANGSGEMQNIYNLAHRFWMDNKKKFEKSAAESGEKKGYGSYVTLANAYNKTKP